MVRQVSDNLNKMATATEAFLVDEDDEYNNEELDELDALLQSSKEVQLMQKSGYCSVVRVLSQLIGVQGYQLPI